MNDIPKIDQAVVWKQMNGNQVNYRPATVRKIKIVRKQLPTGAILVTPSADIAVRVGSRVTRITVPVLDLTPQERFVAPPYNRFIEEGA